MPMAAVFLPQFVVFLLQTASCDLATAWCITHLCQLSWLPSATRCGPASAGTSWVFLLFPGASFSPQKPQVTEPQRFPNESYSCLCTCLTCPNPSTPGWKRFVNQPTPGSHLVQTVASFNSIRCRRSRYLPLRMKAHGPRSSSWHPHRANNGPSTAIGAIRPSNHFNWKSLLFKNSFRGLAISCNVFYGSPSTLEALRSIAKLLHGRRKHLCRRQRLVGLPHRQAQEREHLFKRMPLPDCPWRNLQPKQMFLQMEPTFFSFAVTL